MKRSVLRENVFKLLFTIEFHEKEEISEQNERYLGQLEVIEEDRKAIGERTELVESKLEEIDAKIGELSVGWKLDRIGKAELAIIRLAVFEILFDDSVPAGVAINEAVELAKKYGGDDSPSFVNGVLGKLTK